MPIPPQKGYVISFTSTKPSTTILDDKTGFVCVMLSKGNYLFISNYLLVYITMTVTVSWHRTSGSCTMGLG